MTGLMGLRMPWNGSPSSCCGPGVKPVGEVTVSVRVKVAPRPAAPEHQLFWEVLTSWAEVPPLCPLKRRCGPQHVMA